VVNEMKNVNVTLPDAIAAYIKSKANDRYLSSSAVARQYLVGAITEELDHIGIFFVIVNLCWNSNRLEFGWGEVDKEGGEAPFLITCPRVP